MTRILCSFHENSVFEQFHFKHNSFNCRLSLLRKWTTGFYNDNSWLCFRKCTRHSQTSIRQPSIWSVMYWFYSALIQQCHIWALSPLTRSAIHSLTLLHIFPLNFYFSSIWNIHFCWTSPILLHKMDILSQERERELRLRPTWTTWLLFFSATASNSWTEERICNREEFRFIFRILFPSS